MRPGGLEKAVATVVWKGGQLTLSEYGRNGQAGLRLQQKAARLRGVCGEVAIVRATHGRCFCCDRVMAEEALGVFPSMDFTTNLTCLACSDESGGWVEDSEFPCLHRPCVTKGCTGTYNPRDESGVAAVCSTCAEWSWGDSDDEGAK